MKARMINNKGKWMGLIDSEELYNKVRDGKVDWKPEQKANLKTMEIPISVFNRLLELDREAEFLAFFLKGAWVNAAAVCDILNITFDDAKKLFDCQVNPEFADHDEYSPSMHLLKIKDTGRKAHVDTRRNGD